MENLFTRKQLEKMEMQAFMDLVVVRPNKRLWMEGTAKMNKTELVAYIRKLWNLRLDAQGLSV
jgi:hypothetical protein